MHCRIRYKTLTSPLHRSNLIQCFTYISESKKSNIQELELVIENEETIKRILYTINNINIHIYYIKNFNSRDEWNLENFYSRDEWNLENFYSWDESTFEKDVFQLQ